MQLCSDLLHAEMLNSLFVSLIAGIMRNGTATSNVVEFSVQISTKLRQYIQKP
jgi:hypothetical protein